MPKDIIPSNTTLAEINLDEGITSESGQSFPFAPTTRNAIERLQSHLGEHGAHVIPVFQQRDEKAHLSSLINTASSPLHAQNALNRLLLGSKLANSEPASTFTPDQTAAIIEALPPIGRRY